MDNLIQSHQSLSDIDVLTVHAVIITLLTGVNVSPLLEARRNSLKPFLPDRELLILEKRRGHSTHAQSLVKKVKASEKETAIASKLVGDYFRQLCAFTEPFKGEFEEGDFVFIYRSQNKSSQATYGKVIRMDNSRLHSGLQAFINRHKLKNDKGKPLQLNLARLRPTFATNLLQRTHDIRKVQRALGHSDPNTTARYYLNVTPEAQRDHAFYGQAMVDWVSSKNDDKAQLLAADGQIPLSDAKQLLSGGYNTGIAHCKNPFRDNGQVCGKYLKCFDCPNLIIFEDDLYRLYSFYYYLLSERTKIAIHQWMKTYGWVIKIIDDKIGPQFEAKKVELAKQQAQKSPHPTWAMKSLL